MRTPLSTRKAGTRWPLLLCSVLLAIAIGVGVGEWSGWPWLVSPAQSWLSKSLERRVNFGPLSLRTPVHVRGTFSKPAVSLEVGKLAGKAGAAVLLALLNPLAAIIPFIDPGADKEARQADAQCAALVKKQSWISKPVPHPSTTHIPKLAPG